MSDLLLVLAAAMVVAAVTYALHQRALARRARRETEAARAQGRRAGDAGETFLDLATHELRSPLSAILGYQELLADGAYGTLPEPAQQALDRIGRSAHHLVHLIDGIIELSRLRSGTLHQTRDDVDLAVLFAGVAESFRDQTTERGIQPGIRMGAALPTIETDRQRLVRALDLLVTSAIKHPAQRELTLEIDGDDDAVRVSLHQTDIRVRPDATDSALRLGLRLEIVARVAHLLGGSLRLEPAGGERVRRLTLTLPYHFDGAAPPR